jgi:hypothetical protein
MNESTIVAAMLFSAIGFGYFIYGRKQRRTVPFVSGIGLFAIPYLIDSNLLLLGAGAVLLALPFLVKI